MMVGSKVITDNDFTKRDKKKEGTKGYRDLSPKVEEKKTTPRKTTEK